MCAKITEESLKDNRVVTYFQRLSPNYYFQREILTPQWRKLPVITFHLDITSKAYHASLQFMQQGHSSSVLFPSITHKPM